MRFFNVYDKKLVSEYKNKRFNYAEILNLISTSFLLILRHEFFDAIMMWKKVGESEEFFKKKGT